jgi:hypothetical protein
LPFDLRRPESEWYGLCIRSQRALVLSDSIGAETRDDGNDYLDYVSSDNNLTQMFMQGYFGQAGSFALPYIFQAGGSDQLTANALGINFTQSSLTFPSIHELVVLLNLSATSFARQGEYRMVFPSTCISNFYLTIGSLPTVAPSFGVLTPAVLILFDIGVGLLGDLFLFLAFRISDARSHEILTQKELGTAMSLGDRGQIFSSHSKSEPEEADSRNTPHLHSGPPLCRS